MFLEDLAWLLAVVGRIHVETPVLLVGQWDTISVRMILVLVESVEVGKAVIAGQGEIVALLVAGYQS